MRSPQQVVWRLPFFVLLVFLSEVESQAQAEEPLAAQQRAAAAPPDVAPVDSSLAFPLRYNPAKTAVETTVDGRTLSLSWKDTFVKSVGRYLAIEHEKDEVSWFVLAQGRLRFDYGQNWSANFQASIEDRDEKTKVTLDEARINWTGEFRFGKVLVKAGRQWIQTMVAVPQPYEEALDGALTDELFYKFGDGVSISYAPIKLLVCSLTLFKRREQDRLPDHVVADVHADLGFGRLGVMGQVGPIPREDWLISVELTGTGDHELLWKIMGVVRHLRDEMVYGLHSYAECAIVHPFGVCIAADALQRHTWIHHHHHHSVLNAKVTGGVWCEPISWFRLEVEVGGDWERGHHHRNALETMGGAIFQF